MVNESVWDILYLIYGGGGPIIVRQLKDIYSKGVSLI